MSAAHDESERTYPDGRPLAELPQWKRDFPTDVHEDHGLARREFTWTECGTVACQSSLRARKLSRRRR
jgi:hypothetical protein